ncbi:MAG: HAMP domain-containing histidine kinase [Solobacterium sp.]|nr:HAMP domain-containing histidine kinase [Solobacterium sp.]
MIYAFLILVILVLVVILFRMKQRTDRSVDQLIDYLTRVQDRREMPPLQEEAEGRMKILQSEIYKVSSALMEEYANEAAKNRYLEDMLENISHQIKTPLTSIVIMNDLLKRDALSEAERKKCLIRIDQETSRITWLTMTLLTIARLDAGSLVLKKEEVRLKDVIDDILSSLAIQADLKDVAMKEDISENIIITGDKEWTREAFLNIIKNCLEHTDSGSIIVKANQTNIASEVIISDTGKGIDPRDLPHIFERFYRGSNSGSGSIGIGLALSKLLVNMQNGVIDVSSEVGKGTAFTIRFYRDVTI